MASLARPVSFARPLHSSKSAHSFRIRSFSSTPQNQSARMANGFSMKNMPKQESMATRMKKLKQSEIPSDVGLLPMTYVRPCGNMPSVFSQPRTRLWLEWHYLRQSFMDLAQAILYNRWQVEKDPISGKRKKLPLSFRERYTIARDLHTQLYSAIAKGDKATISKIACSGLENQQNGRLERRRMSKEPAESWSVKYSGWVLSQKLLWTIQSLVPSWFKAIHVVADRHAPLPVGPGVIVRQIVVRIDSTQTRDRNNGSAPVTKKLREYLVLQRYVIEGKPQEWKIQGTVLPTDTEEALEIMEKQKTQRQNSGDPSFMERVRERMNMPV